jgi:hypothetical protein
MCRRRVSPQAFGMTAQRLGCTRRLILDLVVTAPDSISGRLCDATGRVTEFVGWLGLAGALEALSAEPQLAARG